LEEWDRRILPLWNTGITGTRPGLRRPGVLKDSRRPIHEMRLRKGSEEIGLMQRAADISVLAHEEAMRFTKPGMREYEVEAALEKVFAEHGAHGTAYDSIVASGVNATVLHYMSNRMVIPEDSLVLIDAGCEYGWHASDITRTFPASGTFTKPQAEVYDVVLAAQEAAIEMCVPGTKFNEIHERCLEVLVEGAVRIGLLEGDFRQPSGNRFLANGPQCRRLSRPRKLVIMMQRPIRSCAAGSGRGRVVGPDRWRDPAADGRGLAVGCR